jgi:hydroxyacylglutathione hydrolase
MQIKHFFVSKIAHSSYLLTGQNYCAIIDPERDVDVYITEAEVI